MSTQASMEDWTGSALWVRVGASAVVDAAEAAMAKAPARRVAVKRILAVF